jgi:hypothetical protein
MKLFGASLLVALFAVPVATRGGTVLTTPLTGSGSSSGFAAVTLNGLVGDLVLTFNLSSPIASGSGIYDSTETFLLYPLTIPLSPTTSGTIDQVINFASQDVPTLLAGNLYYDVTSQSFPSVPGEIGGELDVVPEPASIGLLALGLAWIAWRLRCAATLAVERTRTPFLK